MGRSPFRRWKSRVPVQRNRTPGLSDSPPIFRQDREGAGPRGPQAVEVTGVGAVALSVPDPGSDFVIEFLPVEIRGEPECLEHMAVEWRAEEELLSLPLAPSDRRYVAFRRDGGGDGGWVG